MACILPGNVKNEIIALAKKYNIEKVILFGSRARGSSRERSDIDLAVSGGDITGFSLDIDDEIGTLLMFDVVDLDRPVSDKLKEEIEKDGVFIYMKKPEYIQKFENYKKAVDNLKAAFSELSEPYGTTAVAAFTKLYEICFELAWKTMKAVLEFHGIIADKIGSPKMIFKTAYNSGMINDEIIWNDAIKTRNLLVHTYDENTALDAVNDIKERYTAMFETLRDEIEKNWL